VIARATNDVVRDWNIERDEIAWNAALSTVFRYPGPPDVLGLAWWLERIHPDDRDRVVGAMQSALSGGASGWNDEYRFQRGDGTYASVFDRGFITRDGRGRAVRMLGSMLDVTERKVMEAKLIQAERLASMGTLATGVAHEINNPLTYIMANVGYVSERLSRPSPADKAPPKSAEELAEELAEVRAALEEAQEGAHRRSAEPGIIDQHGLERDPAPGAPGQGARTGTCRRGERVPARPGLLEPAPQRRAGHP
jgi:PAS domain S-box-containing protein